MNRSTLLKLILPMIIALAIIFGLIQRTHDPHLKSQTFTNPRYQNSADDKSLKDYYSQAQELAGQQATATTVSFLAVGDIMLSRNVAAVIEQTSDPDLPFKKMADTLAATDFAFANLESPASPSAAREIIGGHSMIFGAPQNDIANIIKQKFTVVNLANNHAFDQGKDGLDATKKLLDDLHIAHTGVGDNLDEAWQPAVVQANGIKLCFVGASYASINDSGKTKNDYVARIEDKARLKTSLAAARRQCDFVVATMHAGVEYTRTPNQAQVDFAHAAIDDGADMVIGAHPHWIQTTEKYQGKYIFYSLGNFIFDQMFSEDTKEGLTLKITVSKIGACPPSPPLGEMSASGGQRGCSEDLQGVRTPAKLESVELIPIIIENYSAPRPATADEAQKILDKIGITSNLLK